MAELFRSWKKKLWKKYLKTQKVPVFEGYLAKQANHWKAFQEYKESEDAQALSEKNKINADKKKYHHKLGPGGYETAIPKWDKKEQDLIDKGIVPEPLRDECMVGRTTKQQGTSYAMTILGYPGRIGKG